MACKYTEIFPEHHVYSHHHIHLSNRHTDDFADHEFNHTALVGRGLSLSHRAWCGCIGRS